MKHHHLFLTTLALFQLLALPSHAKDLPKQDVIEVPAISGGLWVSNTLQSNMVLQRDKPVHVWGWADPGENVTVDIGGKTGSATAGRDRSWKVALDPLPANDKPQTMTIKGTSKTVTLDNILVGDVWILGGQSNMEFELAKTENGNLEIVSARYPQMRILTVPQGEGPDDVKGFARLDEWSGFFNRSFRKGDWDECTPEIAQDLSAIGYVFARRVHMASGIPIGVIDMSRGGTSVESWTPLETLRGMENPSVKAVLAEWDAKVAAFDPKKDLEQRIKQNRDWVERMTKEGKEIPAERKTDPTDLRSGPIADMNHPGACYAGMLSPLKGLSVKGAIWHQGYNNANHGLNGPDMYAAVFPEMIKAWRTAFGDPGMPFGILSLCTDASPQTLADYSERMLDAGCDIRAVQYKTFVDLYQAGDRNMGFASTYDLRRAWYHPQLKHPAGERIARWALATQYGFSDRMIPWKPPVVTGMEATDGKLMLTFDTEVSDPERGAIVGFAIAGEDRRFHPAIATHFEKGKDSRGQVQYDKKRLMLTSIMVPKPLHFRYASARNPLANLQAEGNKDLPFATQRSDDWPVQTVPLGVLPDDVAMPVNRNDLNKLTQALREMDKQRKLAEARQVIKELEGK